MKRVWTVAAVGAALVLTTACGSGSDLSKAETQRSFGVRMARMNLWREAEFRFRRAVQIDPQNARARNNLAVALEANGDFEGATKEYREALRLDRSNEHIQKNYSRLVEFTQKAKRREAPPAARPAVPQGTDAQTPASGATPPPPASAPEPGPAPEPEPEPKAPPSPPTQTPAAARGGHL